MTRAATYIVRDALTTLLGCLYRRLKNSRASPLLDLPLVARLRRAVLPGMREADALEVFDILDAAGVPFWLVGGWGIDALVGRRTRKHTDVDVAVERRFAEPARRSLEAAGFELVNRQVLPAWMPEMLVLRDARRRLVELMPVDLPAPPAGRDGRPETMRFHYDEDSFTTGTIDGRVVNCLAAPVQLLFHTRYRPRRSDRHYVRTLIKHFGLPAPPGFA